VTERSSFTAVQTAAVGGNGNSSPPAAWAMVKPSRQEGSLQSMLVRDCRLFDCGVHCVVEEYIVINLDNKDVPVQTIQSARIFQCKVSSQQRRFRTKYSVSKDISTNILQIKLNMRHKNGDCVSTFIHHKCVKKNYRGVIDPSEVEALA
jgi:hypothetical protein